MSLALQFNLHHQQFENTTPNRERWRPWLRTAALRARSRAQSLLRPALGPSVPLVGADGTRPHRSGHTPSYRDEPLLEPGRPPLDYSLRPDPDSLAAITP